MTRVYRDDERPLVLHLRTLDDDHFTAEWNRELDHLEFLESTKRDKRRIESQRRRCEVYSNVAAEPATRG